MIDEMTDQPLNAPTQTSIEALVHGRIFLAPEEKQTCQGHAYTRVRLLVEAEGSTPLPVRVVTYVREVGLSLLSMHVGDVVSVAGSLLIYPDGIGLNARRLASPFQNTRHNPNPNWSKAA